VSERTAIPSTMQRTATGPPGLVARNATGLVRGISPRSSIIINLIPGHPAHSLAAGFFFVFALFPGGSYLLGPAMVIPLSLAVSYEFDLLTQMIPRSGGDYMLVSRIIHSGVGLISSFCMTLAGLFVLGRYRPRTNYADSAAMPMRHRSAARRKALGQRNQPRGATCSWRGAGIAPWAGCDPLRRQDRHPPAFYLCLKGAVGGFVLGPAIALLPSLGGRRRDAPPRLSPIGRNTGRRAWAAPSLTAHCHGPEPVQRHFGRRPLVRGGQQKRQAGVCAQLRGLEDEIEVADDGVVKAVQARCG
jgi:hypothetical protein